MKKKIFAMIAVMALAFVMCSCGSDNGGDACVQAHQPTDGEQKIVSLLTSAQADVALVDYTAIEEANCATIGYDLYEKGKLTKNNQECLTGGIGPDSKSGMIGLSLGSEEGFAAIYTDDESTCSAGTDTPWKNDKNYEGEIAAQLSEPVAIELDKKIYFFGHLENKTSEEMEAVTPDEIMKDKSSLKGIDKAYVYYVIFKHSKEYE